jgi:hypothetical protein
VSSRVCTKCEISRNLEEFYKGRSRPCKLCLRTYNEKSKERRLRWQKEYQARSREEYLKYQQEYRRSNQTQLKCQKKKYYLENREKIAEKGVAYREAQKDKIATRQKKWYAKNKSKVKAYKQANRDRVAAVSAKRRARKLAATPAWLTAAHNEQIKMFFEAADAYQVHVDHIVPLKGKNVCGLHVPWNLQVLDATTNVSKGNKLTKEGEQLAWMPVK